MAVLDDVKVLLGNPEGLDNKLNTIIKLTESRLKTLLNEDTVPAELEYIVTEVTIIRFNKIGSEGVSSHSVEGESMSFNDNDLYLDDIEAYKNKKNEVKGVLRFL